MFNTNASYSQVGEDRIVFFLFHSMLKRKTISYMDIGANDPVRFSNTFLLYRLFSKTKGILVEANPDCMNKLERKRRRDICVNCGVSEKGGENLYFYRFEQDTLNTFSKDDAELNEKKGYTLKDSIEVPTVSINELHDRYFNDTDNIDFLSIDVEGIDDVIVRSIDFDRWKPLSICIETAEFYGDKRDDFEEICEFLKGKGYIIFADTWINTIFVRKELIAEYISKGNKKESVGIIKRIANKIEDVIRRRIAIV